MHQIRIMKDFTALSEYCKNNSCISVINKQIKKHITQKNLFTGIPFLAGNLYELFCVAQFIIFRIYTRNALKMS